jgi:hypothetical protein
VPRVRQLSRLAVAFALALALALALTLPTPLGAQSAGNLDLRWHTIDGGGAKASGGAFEINGTAGQPDAAPTASGGAFEMRGGYWPGVQGDASTVDALFSDGFE